jgi:hypothetical protein
LQQTLNFGNGATGANAIISLTDTGLGGVALPIMTLHNSDTGTGSAALKFQKNSFTNGTAIGEISFQAKTNEAGNPVKEYARISGTIRNNASSNVDGSVAISGRVNDVLTEFARFNGVDGENNFFLPLDMNGNRINNSTGALQMLSGTGLLTITGGSTNANGTLITASNATANGAIEINGSGYNNGSVNIRTSGTGSLTLVANGGLGTGNIFIIQNGTQNQTSIQMGVNINAFWSNVFALSPSFSKLGCYSAAPHRMRALGYSTSDQSNTTFIAGPYFGRATLVSGTVTVANASIGANDLIFLTPLAGTNAGLLDVSTIAGVSFTITSANPLDSRFVNYMIVINTI